VGGPEPGFSAAWVAIENTAGSRITQIGFIHVYDSTLGVGKICRFWAIGSGVAHEYGCGNQTDDVYTWFKILKQYNADTKAYYYNIYDCGTGSYNGCTSKNASEAAYASAFGLVAAETDFGRSACTVRIMGASSDKQKFATTNNPIEGLHDVGGIWDTKPLGGSGATCPHYGEEFTTSTMRSWDDRNAG
jgi:hypothetical protein